MKLLLAMLLVLGCGNEAAAPVRWDEVERLATPTVPGGDAALFTKALDGIKDTDVSEVALDDAIAWRKAGGALPWRAGRTMEDQRPLQAFRLANALLDRRGTDREAILTVLYLAQRLRAEGPALIDVTIGFTLATKVATSGAPAAPDYEPFAPTEAEVRRAIPADAVHFMTMLDSQPADDKTIGKAVKQAYSAMLVGAPQDRAAYVKHIDEVAAKAQKSEVLQMVITPKLTQLTTEMFQAVDAYRAWLRG